MKIASCAFPVIEDLDMATMSMLKYIDQAVAAKCDLIVFPEAALGGLDISGELEKDSRKCLSLSSSYLSLIRDKAAESSIGIGLGFLELTDDWIWNSYLLYDNLGEISLHYRRFTDGWLPYSKAPKHYGCGNVAGLADTTFGKMGLLLCGDLFNNNLVANLAKQNLDLCLNPMARAFPFYKDIQQHWDEDEFPFYLAEYAKLQTLVIVCNAVDPNPAEESPYCGGAWFIQNGEIVSSLPLLQEGLLIYDVVAVS